MSDFINLLYMLDFSFQWQTPEPNNLRWRKAYFIAWVQGFSHGSLTVLVWLWVQTLSHGSKYMVGQRSLRHGTQEAETEGLEIWYIFLGMPLVAHLPPTKPHLSEIPCYDSTKHSIHWLSQRSQDPIISYQSYQLESKSSTHEPSGQTHPKQTQCIFNKDELFTWSCLLEPWPT